MARLMLLLMVVAPMILISQAATNQNGYTLNVSKNGKHFIERVTVDTRKQSETFHMREASTGEDAGDIVYDFQRKLTMIRVPKAKTCFLKDSIGNVPRPADLLRLLKLINKNADVTLTPQGEENLKIVGKLNDRSGLSKEMADLCANHPIYRVTEGDADQNDNNQMSDPEDADDTDVAEMPGQSPKVRRGLCREICSLSCSGWSCSRVCDWAC